MYIRKTFFVLLTGLLVCTQASAQPPAGRTAPLNEITQIKADLYRAGTGNLNSIFLVTGAGIVLVDPRNSSFATWLADEFKARFTVPVRYVIYSHSHYDHIEGGKVFAATARFIAQEGMLRNMDGRYPHMPGGMFDLNHNGQFEREEVRDRPTYPDYSGVCGSSFFASHDRDGNGHVTPEEYYADVVKPDIVYSERMRLTLGGKTVELIFPGRNHANDGTVVLFPEERVAFSTDFPADALVSTTLRSLPSACGNFDEHPLTEWIHSFASIEALDFDILVQAHGSVPFTKADVSEAREYLEDLRAAVSAGISAGKSLEELKRTVLLEKYRDWRFYDRLREDNIEAAYFNLALYR